MNSISNLNDIYDSKILDHVQERYAILKSFFESTYGHSPLFYIRAPGRVNLIGEHIDYEGYSVLPMAIAKEVLLAVSITPCPANQEGIHLTNVNSKFASRILPVDPTVPIDVNEHDWSHYFLCGYKGIWLLNENIEKGLMMNVVVDGDIPLGSGLSSSSAFVVASAIATHVAAKEYYKIQSLERQEHLKQCWEGALHPYTATEMAELCRRAEQFIGVMGGGMDQAISCLGEQGKARIIHFNPLSSEPVTLPNDVVIVVANSLTVSEKAQSARTHYNKRVVECMLASKLLSKCLKLDQWEKFTTLKQVQQAYSQLCGQDTSLDQMVELVNTHLRNVPMHPKELAPLFGTQNLQSIFDAADKNIDSILNVLQSSTEYKLHDRALHVYSEASRVFQFQQLCNSGKQSKALGALMNDSQKSCAKLYECSSVELDKLTALCNQLGAFGSRLTGAGWGGATVSLIPENQCDFFIQSLNQKFYSLSSENVTNAIHVFACKPTQGSSIFKPQTL